MLCWRIGPSFLQTSKSLSNCDVALHSRSWNFALVIPNCVDYATAEVGRAGESLRFNNLVADCVTYQLAHRVQLQFPHDVGPVSLHRLHTDIQGNRGFLTALAFR